MSEPTFYLFPNHRNFQAGKSQLEKASVFKTDNFWLSVSLLLMLIISWGTGYFYRLSQSEISVTAEILSCETNFSSGAYRLAIAYVFENQTYEKIAIFGNEEFPEIDCFRERIKIYFFPTNPEDASLSPSKSTSLYGFIAFAFALIDLGILLIGFGSFLQNRKERHKYAQLKKADTILSAEVVKTGYEKQSKYDYHFADYRFYGLDGTAVLGQIRSRENFIWPSQIQVGDTLAILYVDDKTHCVL